MFANSTIVLVCSCVFAHTVTQLVIAGERLISRSAFIARSIVVGCLAHALFREIGVITPFLAFTSILSNNV
jgi:hypothetical protein